ncbi:MAG: helix-turn-helix transcriptional regulator [Deltaproteobacteria bacterium]|nr:helix-turn-helix transcriptional regulator [Deltaproteobacteria bacterium]
MSTGAGIVIPLPMGALSSPWAFGDYLAQLNAAGEDPALAIDVLEGGLLAAGEGASELAELADWYTQATSRDARRRFSDLIAGRLQHPDNSGPAQRSLSFWRTQVRPPESFPLPNVGLFQSPSQLTAAAAFQLSAPAGSPARRPASPIRTAANAAAIAVPLSPHPSVDKARLRLVLMTGLDTSPDVVKRFSVYRDLTANQKRTLTALWEAYNRLVFKYRNDEYWWDVTHPEYTSDPLRLSRDVAETEGLGNKLSPKEFTDILKVHFQIREALSREQILEVRFPSGVAHIPYQIVDAPPPTHNDRTFLIVSNDIQETLARFEHAFGALPEEGRRKYFDALVPLEVTHRYVSRQKDVVPIRPIDLSRRFFLGKKPAERRRLIFLYRLLQWVQKKSDGDAYFQDLPDGATLKDIAVMAAKALGMPLYLLCEMLGLGRDPQRLLQTAKTNELSLVLKIFNLFKIEKPWEILFKLYREELQWAFRVKRLRNGLLVFEISDRTDLASLRQRGLGFILDLARVDRHLSLRDLAEKVAEALGSPVNFSTLALYGENAYPPGFAKLRAVVQALNTVPSAPPVSSGDFFLAAYPTFIGLLPLVSRERRTLLSLPIPRHYRMASYPASRSSRLHIHPRPSPSLPTGLMALIQRRRVQLGLSLEEMADRLGVHPDTIRRIERGPLSGSKWVLDPQILRLLIDPRVYGLRLREAIAAHQDSYWKEDPAVRLLVQRTFHLPVLIASHNRQRIQAYARYPFQTPGELLYYWQRSLWILSNTPFRFPPDAKEMADFLGIYFKSYANWRNNVRIPGRESRQKISSRLGLSPKERALFRTACQRMKNWKKKEREDPFIYPTKNHRRGKARRA